MEEERDSSGRYRVRSFPDEKQLQRLRQAMNESAGGSPLFQLALISVRSHLANIPDCEQ